MSEPEPIDAKERVENLVAAFDGCKHALILTHDNPDPDALASAFALANALSHLTGIDCEVGYAGIIGRAENRAMLHELALAPIRIQGDALERFDALALVDTQPGFGNNSQPDGRLPNAVSTPTPAAKILTPSHSSTYATDMGRQPQLSMNTPRLVEFRYRQIS